MEKVVLITGASSGIGRETAKLFQTKNWCVAATMRNPDRETELGRIADVEVFRLDVTDTESIHSAISAVLEKFGRIDAVVNNAGYALTGPFEAFTDEQIRMEFETNVFGVMNVCRAVLPYFREQRRGTLINVASVGGRMTFPLYSVYHATKWAIEGFSESLQFELEPFGIRVKIIEPGPIRTDFYSRSMHSANRDDVDEYRYFAARVLPNMQRSGETAPDGLMVANRIYEAATDRNTRLRYPVNTKGLLFLRRVLPDITFMRILRFVLTR
ncbi:MAG: short-chain dehydrogenase/reductase [Blastocatellia bacterium]